MYNDLEDLVAQLRARPPQRSLAGLEADVWSRIAGRQRMPSPVAIWGWRSAAAALLLAVGIMAGSATIAQASPELALFSTRTALAPSTLLGEGR
jgi:hypothetical protein